jgi:single-strand DNA-binding protein
MQFDWTVEGRLVRDPELSFTPSGKSRTWFTIAHDFGYSGPDRKWVTTGTVFLGVTCWGDLAERVANSIRKSDVVNVKLRDLAVYRSEDHVNLNVTATNVALSLRFDAAASERVPSEAPASSDAPWDVPEPAEAPF